MAPSWPEMASVFPRDVVVDNDHRGPLVNIATFFGVTAMVFAVLTRLGVKWSVLRKWSWDDLLITASMMLGILFTVMISMMVKNGLGQNQEALNEQQIAGFDTYGYAAQLAYVPTLCFAKLSALVYLRTMSPESLFGFLNILVGGLTLIWTIISIFGIAFQCQLPRPWAVLSANCFDRVAFWRFVGALDILTDVAIVLLPIYLVWGLQMPYKKKSLVLIAFGSRILILPLTVFRLTTLPLLNSKNQTLSSNTVYLATTIQLHATIFISCIPFLKPFMESLSSGGMFSTVAPMDSSYAKSSKGGSKLSTWISKTSSKRQPARKQTENQTYGLHTFGKSTGGQPIESASVATFTPSEGAHDSRASVVNDGLNISAKVETAEVGHNDLGSLRPDKVKSHSEVVHVPPLEDSEDGSSVGSERMIIKRTRQWDVHVDDEGQEQQR